MLSIEGRRKSIRRVRKEVWIRFGEKRGCIGVQLIVSEEAKDRTMHLVSTAFRDNREQGSTRATVSGREALRRQCKFLNTFHRKVLQDAANSVVLVVPAINRDVEITAC